MSNDLVDPIGSFLKESHPELLEESKKKPLLIIFSASWCGPCRQLQETIEQLKEEKKKTDANQESFLTLKIDISDASKKEYFSLVKDLVKKLNITSIPTSFIFFQGKVIKDPQKGAMKLPQLREFVKI